MGTSDENEADGEPRRLSRRWFLAGSAAAGIGVAAAAATPAAAVDWDVETDVTVIGAGASGLPAAIAARDEGAEPHGVS